MSEKEDILEYAGYTVEAGRSAGSWIFRDIHGREVGDLSEDDLLALHYLCSKLFGSCGGGLLDCDCYEDGYERARETVGEWHRPLGR